jgi:putative signal transducing protein
MEHHPNLVIVQVYGTRPEADLAKSVLASAGIDAITTADTAGGMREHLAWSGAGFQVLVREDDAKEARELLATADEADSGQSQEEDPLKP